MTVNLHRMVRKARSAFLAPLTKKARDEAKKAREEAKKAREEAKATREEAKKARAEAKAAREEAKAAREKNEAASKAVEGLEQQLSELRQLSADQTIHTKQIEWLSSQYGRVPPIPPKHLQERVSGAYYWEFFLHGVHMLADIDKALSPHGLSLASFERILDFGCGCGRFLIPLSMSRDSSTCHGCDIDGEAMGWFGSHFPQLGGLYQNPHFPPTTYADGSFDFVYSVSIFTHLPEDMQFAWLSELKRITKKGGWLVLTTHGRKFIGEMPPKYHGTFNERGFFYLDEAGLTDGLPVFYKGAYHLHHYIEQEWSKYFRVVAMLEQGIGQHQDLILLQNI